MVVYQSHTNAQRFRMDGAEVSVINKAGSPILCGAININDVETAEGQTYTIGCDLACGYGITVSVNRAKGDQRCIHLFEITASGYSSKFYIVRCFIGPTDQVSEVYKNMRGALQFILAFFDAVIGISKIIFPSI